MQPKGEKLICVRAFASCQVQVPQLTMRPLQGCASCAWSCFLPLHRLYTQPVTCILLSDIRAYFFFLTMSRLVSEEAVWGWKGGNEQLPDQFMCPASCTLLMYLKKTWWWGEPCPVTLLVHTLPAALCYLDYYKVIGYFMWQASYEVWSE